MTSPPFIDIDSLAKIIYITICQCILPQCCYHSAFTNLFSRSVLGRAYSRLLSHCNCRNPTFARASQCAYGWCNSFPQRLQGLRCQFDRCRQGCSAGQGCSVGQRCSAGQLQREGVQKVKPLSTQGLRPVNLIDLLGK